MAGKKWITVGQLAEIFLTIVKLDDRPTAVLIERELRRSVDPAGFRHARIRAAMLAEVGTAYCLVTEANILGHIGFGLNAVAATALDIGRTALHGLCGIARGLSRSHFAYASTRKQFGGPERTSIDPEKDRDMVAGVRSSRLMCIEDGAAEVENHPDSIVDTVSQNMLRHGNPRRRRRCRSDPRRLGCSGSPSVAVIRRLSSYANH